MMQPLLQISANKNRAAQQGSRRRSAVASARWTRFYHLTPSTATSPRKIPAPDSPAGKTIGEMRIPARASWQAAADLLDGEMVKAHKYQGPTP